MSLDNVRDVLHEIADQIDEHSSELAAKCREITAQLLTDSVNGLPPERLALCGESLKEAVTSALAIEGLKAQRRLIERSTSLAIAFLT